MDRVAIVGASGFVGTALLRELRRHHQVVALSRTARQNEPGVEWRACDIFSLQSTKAALAGCTHAYYLVHSMMPSTGYFQGRFRDTDLLLADNFARACVHNGVQRIVYLGGLVPQLGFVSEHLQSRREVEDVLRASDIAVTCFRAGLIVGPGGGSFEMLRRLVERLPWMALPRWARSRTQAVFIDDVVRVLVHALSDARMTGETLDLVNGEALSYEDLLRQTAAALALRRVMIDVPISSTAFSKRWVQLFSGASFELVSPLIDSLQCDLPVSSPREEIAALIEHRTFARMLRTLLVDARPAPSPRAPTHKVRTVRSVQRLPSTRWFDARAIAAEYMSWLPRFFAPIITLSETETPGAYAFRLRGVARPLLLLRRIEDDVTDRVKFHVVGGLLAKDTTRGWLEFRLVARGAFVIAAIHEFVPALPWILYRLTQAPVHAWVMRRFGRRLAVINARREENENVAHPTAQS